MAADDFVTRADFVNAVELIAQMLAQNVAKQAESIAKRSAVTPIRGTVTAIDQRERVQIRRATSRDEFGEVGEPDPVYYQLVAPGRMPRIGEEVFGLAWRGGVYILGPEGGPEPQ